MNDLTNAERETILTLSADDRGTWNVFCDDPVMIRKLEKIGATLTEDKMGGKVYTLPAACVLLRKQPAKRQLTDDQRAELAARMRSFNK